MFLFHKWYFTTYSVSHDSEIKSNYLPLQHSALYRTVLVLTKINWECKIWKAVFFSLLKHSSAWRAIKSCIYVTVLRKFHATTALLRPFGLFACANVNVYANVQRLSVRKIDANICCEITLEAFPYKAAAS